MGKQRGVHVISFKSYLYRLAKNALFDYLRRTRIEVKVAEILRPVSEESPITADSKAIYNEYSKIIKDAIELLPPKRKEIVELRTQQDLSLDNGTICPPYSLMTGFIGTAWINNALSDNGRSDMAYRLLQQTTYPSWLYSIEQGATTIWERLNSYTHTNGFGGNNRMNSFNNYSFGAVGAWMYNYSLGIERDEDSPGFKHFILKPEPDPTGKMTYAKGYYDSMYGRIESSWEKKNGTCNYRFVVPANSSATVYIPEKDVTGIGKRTANAKGVKFMKMENGKAVYEVGSGIYHFKVQ